MATTTTATNDSTDDTIDAGGLPAETGSPKRFHIFISYRVRTDAELAEKLCDKLQALAILNEQRDVRVKCFLDKQNLTQGEDFQSEFMAGLKSSCLFLPLISEECLKSMTYLVEGGEDNVVREWEIAWDLRCKKEIDIVPILVGSLEHMDHSYRRFDAFGLINNIPGVMISNSPTNKTARETVSELFKLQGIFLNPGDLSDKITSILNRFSTDVWPKYRRLWADQNILGAEPSFTCVQCLKDYKESANGDGSCRFHLSDGPTQMLSSYYDCCGSGDPENGCTRNRHHSKHHNKFQYGQRLVWMNTIRKYTNSSKRFAFISAGDDTMNRRRTVVGEVGRVFRGNEADRLYVCGFMDNMSWFNVFSKDELLTEDDKGNVFRMTNIKNAWVEARWIVYDGEISGIKERTKDDEFWLPCDFIDEAERVALTVTSSLDPEDQRDTPRDSGFPVARVKMPLRFMNVMVGNLRAIVCKAEDKHGRYSHEAWGSQPLVVAMDATETLAPGGSLMIGEVKTLATAFVDLRRRCVFAVRFELDNDTMHTVGFWPVPAYGDALVDQDAVEPVDAAPIPPGFFEAGVDWKGLEPTVLQGNVGLDKSFEQPKTPVNSRVNFAPNNSVGGDGSGGISGADLARIAEVVRAAVRTDLETLVRDTVRTEIAAAVERLERAISDASTATAVVTVRQLGRRLSASSHGEAPSPDD